MSDVHEQLYRIVEGQAGYLRPHRQLMPGWIELRFAAGVDPTEGEHFEKVDTAYKGYSVLADEAAQIEANCALPSGEHIGRPFRLMPWQKEWVNELYACDAKGDLRYRWSLLGIPRKNGKSTRIAVLALYHLMADPDEADPRAVCAAAVH